MSDGLDSIKENLEDIGRGLVFKDWVLSQGVVLKGIPFSFQGHEELEQIYDDMSRRIVIQKATQMGLSTWAILYLFWRAAERSAKGMYFGPSKEGWIKAFVKDRVHPIIEDCPAIKKRIHKTNSTLLKRIGSSSIHFKGLKTKADVTSVDADTVVIDEVDIVDQDNKEETRTRVGHSADPVQVQLSMPTSPGHGINNALNKSDQHFRLLKCPACGKYNNPVEDFPKCLMPRDKEGKRRYLGCRYCQAELDPHLGEWVPRYPGKSVRGYQVSRLTTTRPPIEHENVATEIWELWTSAEYSHQKKLVMNADVGMPYAGALEPITDLVLTMNQGSHGLYSIYPGPSFLGYDQGDILRVVVAHFEYDQLVVHWFEETTNFDRLDELMVDHNVWFGVGDAMPNKHSAKTWALRNNGYAAVCYFSGAVGELNEGKEEKDGTEIKKYSVDRDESLDEMVEDIQQNRLILPARNSGDIMETVWEHCRNLVKEKKKKADGSETLSYKHNENHFGMALNYLRIATKISTMVPLGLPLIPSGASFYDKGGGRDH